MHPNALLHYPGLFCAAARLTDGGSPTPFYLVVYSLVNYSQVRKRSATHGAAAQGTPNLLLLQCWSVDMEAAQLPPSQVSGVGTDIAASLARGREALRSLAESARGGASRPPSPLPPASCIPPWRLMLRLTADFVSFSAPVELAAYASPGWAAAPLQYPMLLSGDGTRQDEVDAAGFYVLGACSEPGEPCGATYGPQVTAARVAVSLSGA